MQLIVPADIAGAIMAQCFVHPKTYFELGKLCDTVGGRTSGAESGKLGEMWAHQLMSDYGLQNVHYQEFPVSVWIRGSLKVICKSPTCWMLTALSHGNSPSSANISASVINLGHASRKDYELAAGNAAGRVVLCDEGVDVGDRSLHRSEKLRLAVEFGAAALMIYSSASGGLPRTGVCSKGEATIPSVGISQEDGMRLLRLITSAQNDTDIPEIQIQMSNKIENGVARNVIGDIIGSEFPEQIVIAGGHLDSWDVAQGATDNGLGSAIVLDMARALARSSHRPRRTMRFAIWAAEEIGLCGSKHYVEEFTETLADHIAVVNFDMTSDPYGYLAPRCESSGNKTRDQYGFDILSGLCNQLAPVGMRNAIDHKAGLHSDHQPFMLAGVQAIALQSENKTEGAHYYHSVGDTFEKVSLPAFARATAVGAHTMSALANAPERPFTFRTPHEVRTLIDEANLYDALVAEGYDGPLMHV